MSAPILRIEHLKKEYPNAAPLRDANLSVQKGNVIAVIGPSGTGKSTLLRLINRLEKVTAGKIFFRDEEITAPNCDTGRLRQKIGMIFQSFNLFSHLTVIENIIAAPVALKNRSRQQAYDEAKNLLSKVGLTDKMFNYPDELSGGQQQRIAIVRALAMEPEMLLLDEPTSALDPSMTGDVETVIRQVAQTGVTMMMVTHSMELAKRISSRILYMDEGGVYEEGTPQEIFLKPKKDRTRQFIERLKVLDILIDPENFDFYGCHSAIENFCRKNNIHYRMMYSLMMLFEEIYTQILIPQSAAPQMRWLVEYSDTGDKITVRLAYGGAPFDIRTSDNELSLKLIKGIADIEEYELRSDEPLPNRVLLIVRKR